MCINALLLKKKDSQNYTLQILTLCAYLAIATREQIVIMSIIFTLLLIAIKQITISKNKKNSITKQETTKIPVGYYLCFSNIVTLILNNFLM